MIDSTGHKRAIEALYHAALEREPGLRAAFLSEACPDAGLRREVEALLQARPSKPVPARRIWLSWLPWLVAALAILGGAGVWLWPNESTPATVVRFQVQVPGQSGARSNRLYLSPDGLYLAFVAPNERRRPQIFLRRLDSLESKPLRNTEGASSMFWSGDSSSLAFSDGTLLRRMDIGGGEVKTLGDAMDIMRGGAWSRDGVVLYKPAFQGWLQSVSDQGGGVARPATKMSAGEIVHAFPTFLPDDRHFVFRATTAAGLKTTEWAALESSQRKKVADTDNPMLSVTDGAGNSYLAYQRLRSLLVQEFDWKRGKLKGEPVELVSNLRAVLDEVPFSFSETGRLAYVSTSLVDSQRLIWYDRSGKVLDELPSNGTEFAPALSPDGKRLAVGRGGGGDASDIWVADLSRKSWTRLSFGGVGAINPVWSPDGTRIAYALGSGLGGDILERDSTGTGEVRVIGKATSWPQSWSPDGRNILYVDPVTQVLMAMPVVGDRRPFALTSTKSTYYPASYSPDGQYVAYTTTESGRPEVYVIAVPPAQGKWKVSTDGGGMPAWRGDGKELFYIAEDLKLMAVDVKPGPPFGAGAPHPLFQTSVMSVMDQRNHYVVSLDGQRFLITSSARPESSDWATVVLNWPVLLHKSE
jgi:Tol biopolymer transport system component